MRAIIVGVKPGSTVEQVQQAVLSNGLDADLDTVIVGGSMKECQVGEDWANEYDRNILAFDQDWEKYGTAAEFRQLDEMMNNAETLIAIWDGKDRSVCYIFGLAKQRGLSVYIKIV